MNLENQLLLIFCFKQRTSVETALILSAMECWCNQEQRQCWRSKAPGVPPIHPSPQHQPSYARPSQVSASVELEDWKVWKNIRQHFFKSIPIYLLGGQAIRRAPTACRHWRHTIGGGRGRQTSLDRSASLGVTSSLALFLNTFRGRVWAHPMIVVWKLRLEQTIHNK